MDYENEKLIKLIFSNGSVSGNYLLLFTIIRFELEDNCLEFAIM